MPRKITHKDSTKSNVKGQHPGQHDTMKDRAGQFEGRPHLKDHGNRLDQLDIFSTAVPRDTPTDANTGSPALNLLRTRLGANTESTASVQRQAEPGGGWIGRQAIQRKIDYEHTGEHDEAEVIKAIANFESKEKIESSDKLGKSAIQKGMENLAGRSENFGSFDLSNYQQVALLYHQIKKQATGEEKELAEADKPHKERAEKEAEDYKKKQESEKISGYYKLALLGMGSSIGYYVSSLGRSFDHQYTIIIGKDDPWAEKRGGKDWIVNHPKHAIEAWGKEVPKSKFATRMDEYQDHKPKDIFAGRAEFAQQTKEAINSAKEATQVKAQVKRVGKIKDMGDEALKKLLGDTEEPKPLEKVKEGLRKGFDENDYMIQAGDAFFVAKKVVMGTGGGPHRTPDHAKEENIKDQRDSKDTAKSDIVKDQVMDMDAFMRLPKEAIKNKEVVVQGTNAGIDAADRAIMDGGKLIAWLGSSPPFLHKTLLKHATKPSVRAKRVATERKSEKISVQNGGKLKISFTKKEHEEGVDSPVTADYFVYAIGQDINAEDESSETSGPAAMLTKEAKEALIKESAIIKGDSAGAYGTNHGLGLREGSSEKGLEVIGAAAWRLNSDARGHLDKMADEVPSNVASYEQLAPLKAATGALNTHMPEYTGKGFNWMTANVNMVRAYLTIKHGDIDDKLAAGFMKAVLQLRRMYPNGIPEIIKTGLTELKRPIKDYIVKEMGDETNVLLNSHGHLSRGETIKKLKATTLYLLREKQKDIEDILDANPSQRESLISAKVGDLLPNKALPRKKET